MQHRLRITRWEDVKQQWHKFKVKNRIIRAARLDCAFGITKTDGEWISGHAGDWLIEEMDGSLVPCRHDDFLKTYEPVSLAWPIRRKHRVKKNKATRSVHPPVQEKPKARANATRRRGSSR